MILFLTNTFDGTADILIDMCHKKNISVFRWNIDIWYSYAIESSVTKQTITDPIGNTINLCDDNLILLWRKPFIDLMHFPDEATSEGSRSFAKTQIREWLNFLIIWLGGQNKIRLINPRGDQKLPKLHQLKVAKPFFLVPEFEFSTESSHLSLNETRIVKSLGDPSVGKKIFYTQKVNTKELQRPFPWFTQLMLASGQDVTCTYINGSIHFYVCDFKRSENSIDWRVEINTDSQSKWQLLVHKNLKQWENAVDLYMKELGQFYGRLDFILTNDELWFLECNSNGQFGWLDDIEQLNLHKTFLDAVLNPNTIIKI